METVLLTIPPGIAPRTKDGSWGIVMLHVSGKDAKDQWFDYHPSVTGNAVRAKWPLGTMMATVTAEVADALVQDGYARVMTLDEARAYNKRVEKYIDETTGVKLNVS